MTVELKPNVKHGSITGFARGCRCDPCRLEWNRYYREWRKNAKLKTPKKHGTVSSYSTYGCRCALCKEASSTYHRNRRRVARNLAPDPMPTPVENPQHTKIEASAPTPERFDQHDDLWAPVFNRINELCVVLIDTEGHIDADNITAITDLCSGLQKRGVDKVPAIHLSRTATSCNFQARWQGGLNLIVATTTDDHTFDLWHEANGATVKHQADQNMSSAIYFIASRMWDFR
jgi:hypothetical protein